MVAQAVSQRKPETKPTWIDMNRWVANGTKPRSYHWEIVRQADGTFAVDVYRELRPRRTIYGVRIAAMDSFPSYRDAWHQARAAAMEDARHPQSSRKHAGERHRKHIPSAARRPRSDRKPSPTFQRVELDYRRHAPACSIETMELIPHPRNRFVEEWAADRDLVSGRRLDAECPKCGHIECGCCWFCKKSLAWLEEDQPVSKKGYVMGHAFIAQAFTCACNEHAAYVAHLSPDELASDEIEQDAPLNYTEAVIWDTHIPNMAERYPKDPFDAQLAEGKAGPGSRDH
jgi:hypothetical protein